MSVMPRGDALDWRLATPDAVAAPIDPQDFFEVFGNLLDNARKWAASRVEIAARLQDDGWEITVCDDGPGVPEAAIGEVLKRGGRLDERRTGAGLGLAIAARVLEAYGGALEIANRPEGGARILVRLPDGALPQR